MEPHALDGKRQGRLDLCSLAEIQPSLPLPIQCMGRGREGWISAVWLSGHFISGLHGPCRAGDPDPATMSLAT